jgi:hypothetical protein
VANPEWPFNGRSPALFVNSCTSTTRLVADDARPFDLKSIWLASLASEKGSAVTFVGTKADNTQVRTSLVLDDRKVWKRYDFSAAFTNRQYAMSGAG